MSDGGEGFGEGLSRLVGTEIQTVPTVDAVHRPTTAGRGALLNAAANVGARRCLLGIGGNTTNDAGFGLAWELAWWFFKEFGT